MKNPLPNVSRRSFLASTSAAAAAVQWTAKSYGKVIGANERIRIGFLGAGGMAGNHFAAIRNLAEKNNLEPIAVADCWKTRADEGAAKVGAKQAFQDFRKVLEIDDIDYVTIATPEHWHCEMILEAMDAGKAVYTEKPMTHTLPEALKVVRKQKETSLPLQVGVQAMSDDSYRTAGQAIREGILGQVVQAQIEYVRRYGEQGPWRVPNLDSDQPKPTDLDWKAWLGGAPRTPWNPHHYFEWRNYSMYSGGIATDLFIHRITRIMKACDLVFPRRVVGMGGIWQWPDDRDLPDNFEMICEYPRGMTVYVLGTMSNRVGIDHMIRGYRGTMYFNNSGWIAKDKDGKTLGEHQKTGGEDISLHHTNFQNHLRNGEELNCPAELGLAGVAAVCMANESWRTGQMMAWNEKTQSVVPASSMEQNFYPET